MEALLSNQFVVLALDALLHIASVAVLGVVVIIACKLLSKGFVDTKLLTGLTIAALLVIMRIFLLNNVHRLLGEFDVILSMAAIGLILFLTSLILVYKLVAIPLPGTILSSLVIVAAQFALAHYTPVLSFKLMPEGQRFAEYAGVSNEKTKQLMAMAEGYQGKSKNNIGKVLKEALGTLAFWSSEEQQENLSKDMASGVRFIQERRAYMESLSEEELAEYRSAMSDFMQEQGVDLQNRYSLENLKNAKPEDLENLANFMKDMNKAYDFTDDLPGTAGNEDEDAPPALESIRQIAQNLKGVDIGEENRKEFAGLLKNLTNGEEFESEIEKIRGQIAKLKVDSGRIIETVRGADLEGMRSGLQSAVGSDKFGAEATFDPDLLGFSGKASNTGRGEKLFSQNADPAITSGGTTAGLFGNHANPNIDKSPMDLNASRETYFGVDYYLPVNTYSDFPEPHAMDRPRPAEKPPEETAPGQENTSDYFPESALSNSLTEDYVLRVPKLPSERSRWTKVANTIRIGAWFEGTGGQNRGTIFIDGVAYRSGEAIEREHRNELYHFRFEGVQDGQVVITSLKRESKEPAK